MRVLPALLGSLLAILTSCSSLIGKYNYNLEVRNIGTQDEDNCEISSASGFRDEPGILIPKAGKIIGGPFKYPYADKWTVTWKTAKGETVSKSLDLTKAFPKSFKGRFVFTIDSENNLAYFTEKFYGH